MAANSQSTTRQIVPRWRTFREALASNELDSSEVGKGRQIDGAEFIAEKEFAWLENKELPFAVDLVSAATMLGTTDPAKEAANFILENAAYASASAQRIARSLLGIEKRELAEVPPQSTRQIIERLKALKAKRINQPRNAFVWVDLARLYVLLGQNESARQVLRVAQMLAPTERFVVRCTARFLHHIKANDEAVEFLRKNGRTQHDPWLVAAEIAASATAEKIPKFAKLGERLLKSEVQPFHTSELAGALATLEMESGNHRAAKKLFEQSLAQPTDNALAQAVWASKKSGLGNFNPAVLEKLHANEALTWNDFHLGKWDDVIFHADRWRREEGFSARPLLLASSTAASFLDKPALGEELARSGLITNPGHPALVNNVAFCLNLQGKPREALLFLKTADVTNLKPMDMVCLLATTGMAYYRLGNEAEGNQFYTSAIERAKAANQNALRTAAILYMAYERSLLALRDGVLEFKKAYDAAEKLKETSLPALAEHMAEKVEDVAAKLKMKIEIRKEKKVVTLPPGQLPLPSNLLPQKTREDLIKPG